MLLCSSLILSSQSARSQTSPVPGLDEYIQRAMTEWNVPGLALAIVKGGEIVYERGYGVRKVGGSAPIDEHTVFSVASTTKAMTVACLGMLVDEGKISWDDPVTKHLPGFQLSDPWVTREMKIRDLLTHRSGLSRGDLLWYGSPYGRDEVIERVRYLEPSWSFRSRYSYQNIMYVTAGEIVRAVSGMSWDDFIQTRLFEPLGMSSSSTSITALEGKENVATPHELVDGAVVPVRWPNFDNVGGAGSVNSSAHDMAQWVRLNLGNGVVDGKRIVSSDVMEEMRTPQMVQRRDSVTKALLPMSNMSSYGLGWGMDDYYGKLLVSHSGWLDGMRTRVSFMPQAGVGVVIIMNGPRARLHWALTLWILDHYLGVEKGDWAAVYMEQLRESEQKSAERKAKREQERIQDTTPAFPLKEYAGTYANTMYGDIEITAQDDGLTFSFGPMHIGMLEHRHYETFQVTWDDKVLGWDDILFTQGFDGKVYSLKWSGVGEFVKKEAVRTLH